VPTRIAYFLGGPLKYVEIFHVADLSSSFGGGAAGAAGAILKLAPQSGQRPFRPKNFVANRSRLSHLGQRTSTFSSGWGIGAFYHIGRFGATN